MTFCDSFREFSDVIVLGYVEIWHFYPILSRGLLFSWTQVYMTRGQNLILSFSLSGKLLLVNPLGIINFSNNIANSKPTT